MLKKTCVLFAAMLCGLALTVPARAGDDQKPMMKKMPAICEGKMLLDWHIRSTTGEQIGAVDDFIVAAKNGMVAYVILKPSKAMGEKENLLAVPMAVLEPRMEEKSFTLKVDTAKLEKAPSFSKTEWPDLTSLAWVKEIDSYYGVPTPAVLHEGKKSGETTASAKKTKPLLRLTALKGEKIADMEGKKFGKIQDVYFDLERRGYIAYVILSTGNMDGGSRAIPVPWTIVKERPDGTLMLEAGKQLLETAPAFDPKNEEVLTREWVMKLHQHYGMTHRWKRSPRRSKD